MNGRASFRVYIDAAGDEGLVFDHPGHDSSRWLILAAVASRRENDLVVVRLMDKVRDLLERSSRQQVHYVKLRHAQKIAYAREVDRVQLRTVSVVIHKPPIHSPEVFQSRMHRLYRYATRLLLERISWLCRDHRRSGYGDGQAEVIFSNRGQMSYKLLQHYLERLREDPQVQVDWSVINPDRIRAIQHDQRAGLQVGDAVASGAFAALNPNRFGDTEVRYLHALLPVAYRRRGKLLGYGLKFWPEGLARLSTKNPRLHALAEGLK